VNSTAHHHAGEGLPDESDLGSTSRIGTDESGKGDFFGPLVVAGVWADVPTGATLATWGIADSKKLSDRRALALAKQIADAKIPTAVVAIGPAKYNELHTRMRNLNRLLGWAHARVMENLLESVSVEVIVTDQFGDASLVERALMERGRTVKLFQMPEGERDIAVAAASVVARAEFLRRLERLSRDMGVTLPKGAGPQVDQVAATIIKDHGVESLHRLAKCHFKNLQKAQRIASIRK
jgi:ribonuclease HIII